MVNIEIQDYKISTDENVWVLHRRKGKKWEAFNWFSTLPALLESLGQRELRKLDAKSLGDIARNSEKIKTMIREIYKQFKFGNERV